LYSEITKKKKNLTQILIFKAYFGFYLVRFFCVFTKMMIIIYDCHEEKAKQYNLDRIEVNVMILGVKFLGFWLVV